MQKILALHTSPLSFKEKNSFSQFFLNKIIEILKNKKNLEIELIELDEIKELERGLNANTFSNFFNDFSDEHIQKIKEADALIFAFPTINFNIPAILKTYFDNVLQANKTFKYKYDHGKGRSVGLIEDKPALIINTQGSPIDWYPFSSTSYFVQGLLSFIGIESSIVLNIDGLKTPEIIKLSQEEIYQKFEKEIEEKINEFIDNF